MSAREHKLEDAGYQFTGEYSSEYKVGKQKMKDAAAKWRTRGYRAQVVSKVYQGRITSSDGHSVYVKPVEPMTVGNFSDYHYRLETCLQSGKWNVEYFRKQIAQLGKAIADKNDYIITSLLLKFSQSLDVHPKP